MLSVVKLALGQEGYYEQQVALGLDDYSAGRAESPGLWAGSGAQGLDLSGVVSDGDLCTLLRGVSLADGERLRAPATERTITMRTLDEASGELRDEVKHEPAERDALSGLRDGDAEGYLGHAAGEERLVVADDPMLAKEQLLADWWRAAAEGNLLEVVMLARRRGDVAELRGGRADPPSPSGTLG